MNKVSSKTQRIRRRARIRSKVFGTSEMPRLAVFKSNKHISVQAIDDTKAVTLASVHSRDIKKGTLLEKSSEIGKMVAEKLKAKNVTSIVFDRGGFMYTGCVKALADGAREGGLKF
jgi:large subunit ribosomal protein L18